MATLDGQVGRVQDLESGQGGVLVPVQPAGEGGAGRPGELVLPDGVADELVAALLARTAVGGEVKLTGQGGLLSGLLKQVLERGLAAELDAHLADGKDAGAGAGNARNGSSRKTVMTEVGAGRARCAAGSGGDVRAAADPEG